MTMLYKSVFIYYNLKCCKGKEDNAYTKKKKIDTWFGTRHILNHKTKSLVIYCAINYTTMSVMIA